MHFQFIVLPFIFVPEAQNDTCRLDRIFLSNLLNRTVHGLQWRRLAVIHDNRSAYILQKLEVTEILIYEINDDKTLMRTLTEMHSQLFPDVNVVVALEAIDLVAKVIHEADDFDIKRNHSTDWSHHSKWLVFSSEASIVHNTDMELNNLQNVAIVTYELEQSGCLVNGVTLASDTSFRHEVEAVPMSLKLFPNTRYRYNTRFLRVSTVATGLCAMVSVKGEMDDIPFTGYCIGALRVIAKHLNLTLVYVKARDNTWGWVDDGMMGQLQRKEIDLVASLMTVHATRAQHVDFIEPYLQANRVVLLYKMPPAAEPIFLLTRPFQASVYMTYVGVTLAVTLVWLVIERCDGFTSQMQGQSVCSLCWNVVRPLLRQGDSSLYITKPGRVLMTSRWLLVIIMSALYCGNLTATLSGAASFKKFQTIEEMINSDFTVGYRPGSSLEQKLKVSTSASVRRLYAKINRDNATDSSVTADSFDVHFQRVQGGSYAFVAYETVVYMFNRSDCSTSVLPVTDIQQESVTFAVQKNSPFKDDINKVMHALIAGGVLTKMKTDSEDKPEGLVCSRRELRVTFTQMIGGLVAGGVGVGLASVCLITEWAYMHVTSTRNFT